MRIAIYQPRVSYYVGGGETVPLEMARYFALHGHEVTILTTKHPSGFSDYYSNFVQENPGINYTYLDLPNSLKWLYKEVPGISQLRWDIEAVHAGRLASTYFEENRFDILNVHYKVDVLASNIDFPTVMFLHGVPTEKEYFDPIWFTFPNLFYVSDSEYIGSKWSELVGSIDYTTFTNGIDTTKFYPIPNISKDIDILYFGRLIPIKGVNYLIETVKEIISSNLSLKVVIAGDGAEKDTLVRQAKVLGVDKYIQFIGHVPQEEILRLYNRSKIFVAPSFDREGILTTMLEAAACSVPTVTTNSCSMPEFIDDGINGFLVPPRNSNSLSKSIELLLKDSNLRAQLSSAARRKAQEWDWQVKSKRLEAFFENIARKN